MRNDIHSEEAPRRRRRPDETTNDGPTDRRSHRGHRRGRGPRGRMARGDVRSALLLLLADEPMHGYQLMTAIAERSGGRWNPSPGAVYPAINQLEDEGLVTVTAQTGRKVAALTDAGREHIENNRDTWSDPFAETDDAPPGNDLRGLLAQLHDPARQLARSATEAQAEAAAKILTDARRSLYLLLADGPDAE